jgi:hypothetical protein
VDLHIWNTTTPCFNPAMVFLDRLQHCQAPLAHFSGEVQPNVVV